MTYSDNFRQRAAAQRRGSPARQSRFWSSHRTAVAAVPISARFIHQHRNWISSQHRYSCRVKTTAADWFQCHQQRQHLAPVFHQFLSNCQRARLLPQDVWPWCVGATFAIQNPCLAVAIFTSASVHGSTFDGWYGTSSVEYLLGI
jgi:hypothetical protein